MRQVRQVRQASAECRLNEIRIKVVDIQKQILVAIQTSVAFQTIN